MQPPAARSPVGNTMKSRNCGTAILFLLAACGGSPFTVGESAGLLSEDAAVLGASDGSQAADRMASQEADLAVSEAAHHPLEEAAAPEAGLIDSDSDTSHADAGAHDAGPEGAAQDASQEAEASCFLTCRFYDQGAYYVNPNYACTPPCTAGSACTVTNAVYDTTFSGTLACP